MTYCPSSYFKTKSSFIIAFIILVSSLIALTLPATAQDSDIFTVNNVKVDVTSANAMDARTEAFEKAQIDAFETLAKRILSEDEAASFETPEALAVSSMIRDYEVTNEKLSAVRYIGTYTFRFKPSPVRRFLTGRGSTFTAVKSKPVLILPYFKQETAQGTTPARIWSAPNPWMQAWGSTVIEGGLVPLTVPIGDISDVRDIAEGNVTNINEIGLRNMLGRYNAGEAVIALATLQGTRMLDIQIFRTDRGRAEFTTTLDVPSRVGESAEMLMERSVRAVHDMLQKNWKTKTEIKSSQKETITINAYFSDLRSWAAMQSALRNTPGVIEMSVGSLTPKSAVITMTLQGSVERMTIALEQSNLYLKSKPSPASQHSQGQVDIYAYMNSYGLNQYSNDPALHHKPPQHYNLFDRNTMNSNPARSNIQTPSVNPAAHYQIPRSGQRQFRPQNTDNRAFEATF